MKKDDTFKICRAIVHTKAGKTLKAKYYERDVEDIFEAMEDRTAMLAFINQTIYVDSVEAIEWID